MRAFIFVTCLAVALAHPEAPYSYNGLTPQEQQHGVLPSAHMLQPLVHQQLPEEHSFSNFAGPTLMTSYIPPATPYSHPIADLQPQPNLSLSVPVAPAYNSQQFAQDSYNMAHLLSSQSHEATAKSAGYPYAPQQTSVHKHIYVHVPPKDFEQDDAVQPRVHHQVGPKQKHYKIVFIKAPSAPAMRAPIVAPPPQHEEKTLIYVLHKKPEESQDIIIPTPAPTKPSKPEVFFIKYKTKKEEAPVYGPPPAAYDIQARHGAPSMEYDAPLAAHPDAEEYQMASQPQLMAPLTTIQPALEQQPQQYAAEMPTELYSAPTMAAYASEEPQPTAQVPNKQYLAPELTPSNKYLAPEPTPSNQYLAPEPTLSSQYMAPEPTASNQYLGPEPIVASEEQRLPSTNYGPPARFFLKKKK